MKPPKYFYFRVNADKNGITLEDASDTDVVEVVRCYDCVHAEESLVSGCVYCNEMERARVKEGFCDWGEKRSECTK